MLAIGCSDAPLPLPGAPEVQDFEQDAGLPDAADSGMPDGPVEEACPPPPADLPTDLVVEADGQFRKVKFPLEGFSARPVHVYLPAGYDEARNYPVVYFTDGLWVFKSYKTHEVMEALVAQGLIEPHIVVAIYQNGLERVRELTPDEDPTDPQPSGDGDAFAEQIVGRVKPFVDAKFATRCGRANTTIAGFSLGGLMCLHMLMRNPEIFGRGLCISPSYWWNHKSILDRFDKYEGPLPIRAWMDVGTKEESTLTDLQTEPPDAQYHEHTHAIRQGRDLAIAKGMKLGSDLGYYEEIDGIHTPKDIYLRMPAELAFTLSDTTLVGRAPIGHAFHVWRDQILAPPGNPYAIASTVSFEVRYTEPYVLTWPNTLVELSADDPDIATIDESGVIQAVAPGTATFGAKFMGFDASDTIEILPAN